MTEKYLGVPPEGVSVKKTTPFEGQKPGTSGLRKKTREFMQQGYLSNYVQAVFDCLPAEAIRGGTLLVAGDGRFYCNEAIKRICSIAAGNGVGRVWVAKDGLATTPACSAIIRLRESGVAFGGFILTASHNPGGVDEDFGIKYNTSNGAPALEEMTDRIYERTKTISEVKFVQLLDFDIDTLGTKVLIKEQFKLFCPERLPQVEVIDGIEDWLRLMRSVFHFPALRRLVQSEDFSFVFDGMNGVAGPTARRLFVEELGADPKCLKNCTPLPDFGGRHPDPNLVYAKELVDIMAVFDGEKAPTTTPVFAAACDGDADRNMILGRGCFVTPSDSVAIIAMYAQEVIPFFLKKKDGSGGIKGLARSMPTSSALDNVAKFLGVPIYETPTGWKFFTNLMDAGLLSLCGEESFGTGGVHVREKDGLWAVLAWLSILAYRNGLMDNLEAELDAMQTGSTAHAEKYRNAALKQPITTVQQIVDEFWQKYGRNYYMRYDFEKMASDGANAMMAELTRLCNLSSEELQSYVRKTVSSSLQSKLKVEKIDVFKYVDSVDGSVADNQGIRLYFGDSRVVWRLSGTGSSGATVRMYFENRVTDKARLQRPPKEELQHIIDFALSFCRAKEFLGTDVPTVMT